MTDSTDRKRVLVMICAAAVVVLLAGSLAARFVTSARISGSGPVPPAASVPEPAVLSVGDLEVPAWGSLKTSRNWPVTFRTDLDLLAPLGDGPANSGEYFVAFAKDVGSRADEAAEAMAERHEVSDLGAVLRPDHPLLLEAEPWCDQSTMRFYPDLLELDGYDTRIPNLLYMLTLAKSWVARGEAASDPALALADFRRAVRLGRLLRQEDVTIIADLVGLACIRLGAEAIYRSARDQEDVELALLASVVLGEVAPQRLLTSERITAGNLSAFGRRDNDGTIAFEMPDSRLDRLMALVTSGPDRRFGGEALIGLNIVRHLGTPAQKNRVEEFLNELTASPDPFLAHGARWALEAPLNDELIGDAFRS